MSEAFIHLHNHMEGSIADATLRAKDAVAKAKAMGMNAIALTDHGYMYWLINFYKECKEAGIKPILGVETYVAPRFNTMKEHGIDNANYHLVLLCENNAGYQNLIKIASDAADDGVYYKPRTDKHKLRKYHEGLIALSACIGGEVQELLLKQGYDAAKEAALMYDDIFGRGNFFLELQDHGFQEDEVICKGLIKMSLETGIPLVATNDCHYLNAGDDRAHDVLMAIQAKTTIYDTKRKKYESNQFYLKSPEEMRKLFAYVPEALENTVKIAERCNVEIEFGVNKIPKFDLPEGVAADQFLRELTYKGAHERYGETLEPKVVERLEYELSVINSMHYTDYFLIVWDVFNYARSRGIPMGPGRGSGAGSDTLYSLNVTKIDPLEHGLLFERFLDPSRISMPDVDSDVADDRRQELIAYIVQKYGQASISQIITFGQMMARAAIRYTGRALDLPYALCDSTSKMIPSEPKITIKKALDMNPDLKSLYDSNPDVHNLIDTAMAVEGLPIYIGTHAAGVLIVDHQGLTAHVPTCRTSTGTIVAQYNMGVLDELGLLKLDILGLKTLSVIDNCIKFVKQNHGIDIKLDELYKCRDTAPLQLIQDGLTDGIFQLEGGGMTQFMKELKPTNISEIVAGISLYRPGPLQYIPQFLENRKHPEQIQYDFEELKPILAETYGVICYQGATCLQIICLEMSNKIAKLCA